ncbi:MAG: phosphate acyltransferase [Candidatus Saccharibacteria bacterium]|nr:phosphate acyltransferase [Candidatus Saccharibacteria bacterium]
MKIVFPEYHNEIIQAAIKEAEDIEAIVAENLEEACAKIKNGEADALIAGIDYTTRDVVLACKNYLGMKDQTFSSCFLLKSPEKRTFILADAGVTKNPTKDQLKDIVRQTYESAKKLLEEEPKIAMLSFSTYGSAKDESIDKINQVLSEIKAENPEIIIDGELQLDAAINPRIAAKKCPDSPLKGKANVLITPDLNSGNILYKAFEQLGDYTAAGPLLQGFNFPASDLSRGSTKEDVLLVINCIKKLVCR